ncbi:MAG: hypothetical protein JST89_04100 [Cyanobacteria bacterium SZAS-4]|nr:hypothetical protein [Cyanobacteria bacterium SZAS-4]
MTKPSDTAFASARDEISTPSAPVDTMRFDVSGYMANEAWGNLRLESAASSSHHSNVLDFSPSTRSAVSATMAEQINSREFMLPDATQRLFSEGEILERLKSQGLIKAADIPAILANPSCEASINRILVQQSKLPEDKKLDYATLDSVIQISRNSETSDSTIKIYRDAILNGQYGLVTRILGESKENRQAYEQVWSHEGESVAQLLEQQNSNLPEDKRLDVLSVNTLIGRYRDGKLSSSLLDQYRKELLDGTLTNTEVRAVSEYPPNPGRIAALDDRVKNRSSQQESALSFLLDPKNIDVTKKVAAKISTSRLR